MLEFSQTPSLLKRINELDEQRENLEQQIAIYKTTTQEVIPDKKIIDVLKSDFTSLKSNSKEEIKKIIQKYIKKITIYSDRFEVEFTFTSDISKVANVVVSESPRPDTMANIKFIENINFITTKKRR